MKVSIIAIGLCIFYFTTSSASPSPQGDNNNPCYCHFPNSDLCRNRRKEIGCSLTDTKESSITTTTTGKLHFYLLTYYLVANMFPNNFNHIIICRFFKKNTTKKCLQCKDKLVSDLPIILDFGKNPKL